MKFHDYADNYAIMRKHGLSPLLGIETRDDMYQKVLNDLPDDPIAIRQVVFDKAWNKMGRPYYDVYPSIIPMLTSLNLNFPGTAIKPPNGLNHLLLRLPEQEHSLCMDGLTVRVIFMSFQKCNREPGKPMPEPGIAIGLDVGEMIQNLLPVYTMRIFPLDERSVEETIFALDAHKSTFHGIRVPDELILNAVRLALTVCLIDDNPEFLERQVLNKDESRLAAADEIGKQKLFDRAKRRGKYGFSLGKSIEVIPHARRPHPCLVWTGKGREIPKIVMRKGSFIHRSRIEQIPTGYEINDDEQPATED